MRTAEFSGNDISPYRSFRQHEKHFWRSRLASSSFPAFWLLARSRSSAWQCHESSVPPYPPAIDTAGRKEAHLFGDLAEVPANDVEERERPFRRFFRRLHQPAVESAARDVRT